MAPRASGASPHPLVARARRASGRAAGELRRAGWPEETSNSAGLPDLRLDGEKRARLPQRLDWYPKRGARLRARPLASPAFSQSAWSPTMLVQQPIQIDLGQGPNEASFGQLE
ncbi:hypothetical protein PtB15_16B397 [Puccinia triticina]|nr:hypothetical protein PtB15_16B397 [Puccinia triticina]